MAQLDWNDRYSGPDYVYGTEPNSFLAENIERLSGPVLSIAEGEGRNAVFLASRGLSVHAVDGSEIGLAKATKLAERSGVNIEMQVANLEYYEPQESAYNTVVSIYAHLPSLTRQKLYPLLIRSLKPGGICILEAYSENQVGRGTGGPSDLNLLMTCSKIESEFSGLETVLLHEIIRDVHEGKFHTGMASVIQFIGRKRA
ncbi:MAG: class I SAM-dependent methyltransferase [Cyanobacteria bacterium P01_G01_bin.54]